MQQPLVCFHIQVVITFLNEIFTAEVSVPYLTGGSPLNLCFKRKCKNKYLKISVWEISLFCISTDLCMWSLKPSMRKSVGAFLGGGGCSLTNILFVPLTRSCLVYVAVPNGDFCTLQPCPHSTPPAYFHLHTHTHVSTHVSTRTHTTSAQVAASAARTADAALIIGCDRRADFISKQSPARERKLTRFGLTLKSSAVFLCNTVLFLGLTWEQRSSQFISRGENSS